MNKTVCSVGQHDMPLPSRRFGVGAENEGAPTVESTVNTNDAMQEETQQMQPGAEKPSSTTQTNPATPALALLAGGCMKQDVDGITALIDISQFPM